MRERILIALVLLFGAVLSGCLEADTDSENGEDNSPPGDQETPPKYLPPRVDGIELPNVTYPNYQFRDCDTLSLDVRVPVENVKPAVPAEFEVEYIIASPLTVISLQIGSCRNTLDHKTIHGEANYYFALVPVTTVNESWSDSGIPDFYVLDSASDNLELIDSLAGSHFLGESADFLISKHSLPEGASLNEFGISSDAWGLELNYRYVPNDPQSLEHTTYLWYGDGPFHRLGESTTYVSMADPIVTSDLLFHEGESSLSSILPTSIYPYRGGSWRADMQSLYQYDGTWGVAL